jgi:rfaE bifunctional protein kinase chain/domain
MSSKNLQLIAQQLNNTHLNKRLVFVSGNFNIIHPGHLRLLNFAKSCGDRLVVGLFADAEPGVLLPFELRQESLKSMNAVSDVISLTIDQLANFISFLKPHAVVKGKEHESGHNPERDVVRAYGGHLIFSSGEAKFSSVDLIRRELALPGEFILRHDNVFLAKHESSHERLNDIVKKFNSIQALVIGDLIIDEYIYCDPLGLSQEDPTIVVTPVESRTFIGGAGIVAGHVASLGAKSRFISITGDDEIANSSETTLADFGVEATLIRDTSRPTILKQRFRASNKTLLRVSHLRAHDIGEEFIENILEKFYQLLPHSNLVIFSDFNYGCLPQTLVDEITQVCRQRGIPFVADSQASSQVGDVSRFVESSMLSATEREVRLAVNDFKSGLQNVANRLLEKSRAKTLIVKLGAEGLLVISPSPTYTTASLKAMNSNPVDVAGAGDAFLSASSLALAAGATIWESAYLGSLAASIQVSRIGNIPLEKGLLIRELTNSSNLIFNSRS